MSKKLTIKEFIEKSIKIHKDKYDYSLVDYVNNRTKVKIICQKHGIFVQSPNGHLNGNGCTKCGKESTANLLKSDNFIEKSIKIHGYKYDYSLVKYINNHIKVQIICKKHGIFMQKPNEHLCNHGCSKCKDDKNRKGIEQFILESKEKHDDKYDYSIVEYRRSDRKVKIICPIHGIFEQTPHSHIHGHGCLKCVNEEQTFSVDNFILKSKKIFGERYDYSLVDYKNSYTKVKIICKIHGVFEIRPRNHLWGSSCPFCNSSKGEEKIREILEKNNIKFIRQKRFKDCKDKNTLPFDFYLIEKNICIEFDGQLHYKSVEYYGGNDRLKLTKIHDKIKTNYCKKNKIKLIRIKYSDNIEDEINKII